MHSRDRTFPVVAAKRQGLEASLALPSPPRTQNIGRGPRPLACWASTLRPLCFFLTAVLM